jgi:hypothetical protein
VVGLGRVGLDGGHVPAARQEAVILTNPLGPAYTAYRDQVDGFVPRLGRRSGTVIGFLLSVSLLMAAVTTLIVTHRVFDW